MKMVKRKNSNANRGIQIIIAAAMIIIIGAAIGKLAPTTLRGWYSNNNINQLDNTVGTSITEHYAPTIIKTDVDNNTCDLSIVVSREDLLRSIVNMNQLGTSETVIQTFWLPNGKPFQFSTTKSDAEKTLALMDAYLEDHPGLVSPPIENILNGIEETTVSEENTDDPAMTEESEESGESETIESTEESEAIETEEAPEATIETEKDTTAINLYARYNVRVDCQFPEDGQYDRYYAAFHDYDIAALHNYCQRHDLLNYTIKGVKSNGAIWNVTISNYVFNNVQTEIDTNPKHASTFTVPVEMKQAAITTEPKSEPEAKPENDSPGNSASENPDVATDEDSATPLIGESEKFSIFTPVVITLAIVIAALILIVIMLVIKIQSAKKRIQLIYEKQEHDEYIDGEYEEIYEETEPEKPGEPEEPQSDEPDEPDEPYGSPTPATSRPSTVDDFFANYVNASKK